MSDAFSATILGLETLLLCLRLECPHPWLPAILVAVPAAGAGDARLRPILPVVVASGMIVGGLQYMHAVSGPVAILGAVILVQSACLCAAGMTRGQAGVYAAAAYGMFAALTVAPAWLAYRDGTLVSHAMGTVLLILLVLLTDRAQTEVSPEKAVRVPGGTSLLRPVVVLAVAALALLIAGLAARPATAAAGAMRTAWSEAAARISGTGGEDDTTATEGLVGDDDQVDISSAHRNRGRGSARFHVVIHGTDGLRRVLSRPLYLRCASADTYEGQRWWTSFPRKHRINDEDDGVEDDIVAIAPPGNDAVTYTVYTRAFVSGLLLGIPTVTGVHLPVVDRHANNAFSSPLTDNVLQCAYTMTSSPILWRDIRQQRPSVNREAPAECLYLPDDPLMRRIAAEAERIAGTSAGPAESIERLLAHLSSRFTYSLDPQETGGSGVLEHFMFHSRQGDCRLFATALTLMLRSRGVPARLVVGYAGGEYNARQRLFTFYRQHAHTWVEVPFEEHGWISMDPTPPRLTAPRQAADTSAPTVPLAAYPQLAELLENTQLKETTGARPDAHPAALSLHILAILVLTAAGIILVARTSGTRNRPSAHGTIVPTAPPGFYAQFCRHFARAGRPRRRGQTPGEFVAQLRHTGCVADEFDDMVEYLYGISYRDRPRRPEFEKEVRKRIRGHRSPG